LRSIKESPPPMVELGSYAEVWRCTNCNYVALEFEVAGGGCCPSCGSIYLAPALDKCWDVPFRDLKKETVDVEL